MTNADAEYWQITVDRWHKESEEMVSSANDPLHGVKYALGIQLRALASRLEIELNRIRKNNPEMIQG